MAVTARIDHYTLLEMFEHNGVVSRLARRARVTGLTTQDHTALLAALAAAGIPAYGSNLTPDFPANLILVDRNVKIADNDPDSFDVDLLYEADNKKQSLTAPAFGFLLGEVKASINQTTSNLDGEGNQIVVSHTFPATDTEFPLKTVEQGGEIQYFQPQVGLGFSGVKVIRFPWLLARRLVGSINADPWFGGAEHEWMCISCTWKPLSTQGSNTYEMSFEFQHNEDTWNPTAVFIDERTTKPPPDLIAGLGRRYIRKHAEVDFEALIGARLQGG